MKSPDQIVAESIAASLLENGLITQTDAASLPNKLAHGDLKDSDWLVLLKMAIPKPAKSQAT